MTSWLQRTAWVAVAVVVGGAAAVVPHLGDGRVKPNTDRVSLDPLVGMPGGPPTSAEGLRDRIAAEELRLREHPDDVAAAVALADALLRHARAATDARATNRASVVLEAALRASPAQYDALRMLGAIYLSQHRFRDALAIARQARALRPEDAWNYGVMGDALVELGEYDQAFAAFDTMIAMRPTAAAYARVAYGRELRGDLDGAVEAMRMAAAATSGQDPEARAWYAAQTGELYLRMGQLAAAKREYQRAAFAFPNYPHAMIGEGKLKIAEGDRAGALAILREQLKRTPTLDLAARVGDLYLGQGDRAEAEKYYELAEDLAGPAAAQTEANLALFLAEHDRKLAEAVTIAETVARARGDVFTEDALAWTYYKVGRLDEALAASQRALRTGTRDDRLVSHAAQIKDAWLRRSRIQG